VQIDVDLPNEYLGFGLKASMAILEREFNSRKCFERKNFIFSHLSSHLTPPNKDNKKLEITYLRMTFKSHAAYEQQISR
jgi:hypothetical protein